MSGSGSGSGDMIIGLTEKEVEAKIASAVEAALARREEELREKAMEEVRREEEVRRRAEEMEQRREEEERRRQEEEERRALEEKERKEREREELRLQEAEWQRRRAEDPPRPPSYNSVAAESHAQNLDKMADAETDSPLMQKHMRLMRRVETLEQSQDGPTDIDIAVTMDYPTRKKVAKSLIKRARVYQQQNDLPTALQYYMKAQPYAADNAKLQHRIDKLREAIETGQPFIPSPTPEGGRYNQDSLACRTVATPSRKRARMGALYEMTNGVGDIDEDTEMPDVDEMGMKRRRSLVDC